MTEDEAKTKWCPQYRVATSGGDTSTFESDNRPLEYEEHSQETYKPTGRFHEVARCIGSACMAWRDRYAPKAEDAEADRVDARWEKIGGYCGLASKP